MLKPILNQRGVSTLELIPILVVFILILNFSLGFFGVIHSGILNSIAARNYAFESFRNRTNLNYIRDENPDLEQIKDGYYNKTGYRFHGVVAESRSREYGWIATARSIKFTEKQGPADPLGTEQEHNNQVRRLADQGKVSNTFGQDRAGVDPVWVKSLYGICMNATCSPPKWNKGN